MNNVFRSIITGFVLFLSVLNVSGQELIKNRLIVKTNDIAKLRQELGSNARAAISNFDVLSSDLGYILLESSTDFDLEELKSIQALKYASFVYYDRKVQTRRNPNDPSFGMQSYLNLINVPQVWELTTGGKTNDGADIVIAILDSGMEIAHPDLKENVFVNSIEVPGDFIDNDANGYIDDISGWNASKNNGTHQIENHGTWVCGIAGAVGNNDTGVSGVNWKVKILPISGVRNVASVIKGYDYILKMKRLYIQTDGKRGANILVSNYSGGLDSVFGDSPEYKPWCDMYNLLGAQGVLSFGSTTNTETNIDVDGDMPSTCSSEFFIAVTSIDSVGVFSRGSGFGTTNIDFAAPGENIFNLRTDAKYYKTSGTSASSPLAAGVAALLFSTPCPSFAALIKSDRIAAARAVRDALFNGVQKTNNLKTYVKYGGYLDAYGALVNMQGVCGGQLDIPTQTGSLAIEKITLSPGNIEVKYITPKPGSYTMAIYDASGKLVRSDKFEVAEFGNNTLNYANDNFVQGVYYFNLISDTANAAKASFIW